MFLAANSWYAAYIAVGLVSLVPNLLLIFIPSSILTQKRGGDSVNFQNLMLSFAAAGLLGDVFLHTLPHLIAPHSHSHGDGSHSAVHDHEHHDHEHDYHDHDHDLHEHSHHGEEHGSFQRDLMDTHHDHVGGDHLGFYDMIGLERATTIGLVVLIGFLVFMFVEKIASHNHNHEHSDDHKDHRDDNCDEKLYDVGVHEHTDASSASIRKSARLAQQNNTKTSKTSLTAEQQQPTSTESNRKHGHTASGAKKLSLFKAMQLHLHATGWLNLLADSMHNFTDGIALGAAFASGRGLAFATFLSVIFHEVPHEIGDFAILVQSGLSKSQAIQAQFVTAIAAFLGTSVGLLAQRSPIAEDLLLSFTAGGFLYLASVTMVPTVVRTAPSSGLQICLEALCFALGVSMMVLVTFYE